MRKKKILGRSAGCLYQQVSMRSGEVHEKTRRSTTSFNQATQMCLPENVICVIYASVFSHFMHSFVQKHNWGGFFPGTFSVSDVISWLSSIRHHFVFLSWSKRFFKNYKYNVQYVFGCLCTELQHIFQASVEGHYVNAWRKPFIHHRSELIVLFETTEHNGSSVKAQKVPKCHCGYYSTLYCITFIWRTSLHKFIYSTNQMLLSILKISFLTLFCPEKPEKPQFCKETASNDS